MSKNPLNIFWEEEPEEEERLIFLAPSPTSFNILDFQLGVRLNNAQFEQFGRQIQVELDISGLLQDFEDLDSIEAKEKVSFSVKNLIHHLGVPEEGQQAIPSWYMSSWFVKVFTTTKQQAKKEEAARAARATLLAHHAIRGGFGGHPPPARPATAPPPRNMDAFSDVANPAPGGFIAEVQRATIDQMIMKVVVWRPGLQDSEEEHEVAASRLVVEGKAHEAHLSKNYSYALFKEIFEKKMNCSKPDTPVQIKFGNCGYWNKNDDWRTVKNQDEFEIALSHLYLIRGRGDRLKFIFQPESIDKQSEREAEEAKVEAERVEILGKADEDRATLAVETGNISPSSNINTSFVPVSPSKLSPHVSPLTQNRSPTSQEPILPVVPRPETKDEPKSPTSDTSRQSGENAKRLSIGSKIMGSLRINSNAAKARHRFKNGDWDLFEEWKDKFPIISKIGFIKGGDDEEEEPDIEVFEEADKAKEDDEVEVPQEDEEEEGTISDEDRVVAQLQELQNLPALSQLQDSDIANWLDCCAMFGIDPTKTGTDEVVTVAGLKTKLYQYQAFGVYWQMLTSRKLGGGFVADTMGLGKTMSFLAYFVVERQLSCLWLEVFKSRKTNDKKHLQVAQHSNGDFCPSRSKAGWIACPCASSSPTSKLAHKPGVRLACVPEPLVKQWWAQWKTHIDVEDATLNLTLVVDHPASFDHKTSIADLNLKSSQPRNKTRLEAEKTKVAGGKSDDTPKDYQAGWLVLTTARTYKKWVQTFEYNGQVRKGDVWKSGKRPGIDFGIAMIDECHEEYFKNKGRAAVLSDIPSASQPFLWGYSGTPFSQTPRGLEGVLWAIEKHAKVTDGGRTGWEADPVMQQFAYKRLDGICRRFDEQVKSKKPDPAIVQGILDDFKPFLLNFMIRRTAETKWLGGHALIKLKPHLHQDIRFARPRQVDLLHNRLVKFEEQFKEDEAQLLSQLQAKWDQNPEGRRSNIRPTKLAFNTLCRLQWLPRIIATFPWLIRLQSPRDPKDFLHLTEDECLGFLGSDHKEKGSPYSKYIRNIVEDSPKCIWLYHFIYQLCEQQDVNGEEQKLVIITNFTQVAFVLKLFIQKYFESKKDRVGLVVPRMKIKDRTDQLEAFTDAVDERGNRKQKSKNFQFLIGTTRLIGQGLQLTRACNVVLMEPDNEFVRELQGYARVHRIGQKNPMSFSYRLIDDSSEVEQRILKRQEDRREVSGRRLTSEELTRQETRVVLAGGSDELNDLIDSYSAGADAEA